MARGPGIARHSVSIQSCASFWRMTGSFVRTRPSLFSMRFAEVDEAVEARSGSRICRPKPSASRSYIKRREPDRPAVVDPAQHLRFVHADVVEEHLVELGLAGDLPERLAP